MIKSYRLEKKCTEMNRFQPHWMEYVERFKSHPEFNPERAFRMEKYIGLFGEIHTDFMLERFAASDQRFVLDPGLSNVIGVNSSLHFEYDYRKKLLITSQGNKRHSIAEYDRVAVIDNLYVVFETRIARRSFGGKKRKHCGFMGLINPEVYKKRLLPLTRTLGQDVGYVVIIPQPGGDFKKHIESDRMRTFLRDDGLCIYLYADRFTFAEDCRAVVLDAGLKIRE